MDRRMHGWMDACVVRIRLVFRHGFFSCDTAMLQFVVVRFLFVLGPGVWGVASAW
jgi:hypothetical protein